MPKIKINSSNKSITKELLWTFTTKPIYSSIIQSGFRLIYTVSMKSLIAYIPPLVAFLAFGWNRKLQWNLLTWYQHSELFSWMQETWLAPPYQSTCIDVFSCSVAWSVAFLARYHVLKQWQKATITAPFLLLDIHHVNCDFFILISQKSSNLILCVGSNTQWMACCHRHGFHSHWLHCCSLLASVHGHREESGWILYAERQKLVTFSIVLSLPKWHPVWTERNRTYNYMYTSASSLTDL